MLTPTTGAEILARRRFVRLPRLAERFLHPLPDIGCRALRKPSESGSLSTARGHRSSECLRARRPERSEPPTGQRRSLIFPTDDHHSVSFHKPTIRKEPMKRLRGKLTYANVVSSLCLFLLLGGGAYAATKLAKNSVGTKQLKNGAVTAAKIKGGSLLASNFAAGQLPKGEKGEKGERGERGEPGSVNVSPIEPLPAGETERGVYDLGGPATGGGQPVTGSWSFPLPLASDPSQHFIYGANTASQLRAL